MPREILSGDAPHYRATNFTSTLKLIIQIRFLRCVRLSPLLSLSDDESQLRLREDAVFVYGGNIADKGNGGSPADALSLPLSS